MKNVANSHLHVETYVMLLIFFAFNNISVIEKQLSAYVI